MSRTIPSSLVGTAVVAARDDALCFHVPHLAVGALDAMPEGEPVLARRGGLDAMP